MIEIKPLPTRRSDHERAILPPVRSSAEPLDDNNDMKIENQNELQAEAVEIVSNRIMSCPSCNSPKFTYYDLRKRGCYLILAAIILAPIFFYVIPGGTLVSTLCILIVGSKGVYLVFKGGSYYICQDCLHSTDVNGNKIGK
jgi:hypothetical protein